MPKRCGSAMTPRTPTARECCPRAPTAQGGGAAAARAAGRHDLPGTFFMPGRVAERYPERVREIVAAGHEIGHHGYTHTSPAKLSRADEEAELVRGARDPARSRCRPGGLSLAVVGVLGFARSTCSRARLQVLVQPHGRHRSPTLHPGTSLVELPIQWILDDAPHFWFSGGMDWTRSISPPSVVREIWWGELRASLPSAGAASSRCIPR